MTKVNGELISIDDSAYDGFKGMTVYGNTVQNLWVNPAGTEYGITATSNEDGTLTLSGTCTSTAYVAILVKYVYNVKPNTTYTASIDKTFKNDGNTAENYIRLFLAFGSSDNVWDRQNGFGPGSRTSFQFTTTSTTTRLVFGLQAYGNPSGVSVSGTYRVMLNEGSEAQPWCPPGLNSVGESGSVEVVTAGKNLFGISQEFNDLSGWQSTKLYDEGDGWVRAETALGSMGIWYKKSKMRFMPGTYTVSFEAYANESVRVGYNYIMNSEDGNVELGMLGADTPTATTVKQRLSLSFTLDKELNGSFMIGIGIGAVGVELHVRNVQLELGSTATAYEPPNITTTPIDLQSHTLNALPDGTRDELHIDGGGNVVLEKRTQKVQLDGDGSWGKAEHPYVHYTSTWSTYGGLPSGHLGEGHFVDKLPASSSVANGLYSANANGRMAYLREPTFASDAAGVRKWMSANKPIVILPLLEPQTIDLGTIELPKLRKKPLVNNIWANGTAGSTGFSLAPEIDYEYNRWSTYCDGFKTHGKHSYFDMGCCIAARDTGTPEKKSVTATVPYMSGFYDLSKLYGAIAFEARQLMYRFEFVEDSREELQRKKSQFLEWLSQVNDEEIADDDIPGRHFIGSLSEWEFEEGEEGQSGSLEVTFNCQPFLEADEDTTKTCNAGSNTVTVEGQAVNAYAKTSRGTATIKIGGATQSVGTTEIRLSVQLQPGDNAVTVTGSPVVLRWKELTV